MICLEEDQRKENPNANRNKGPHDEVEPKPLWVLLSVRRREPFQIPGITVWKATRLDGVGTSANGQIENEEGDRGIEPGCDWGVHWAT